MFGQASPYAVDLLAILGSGKREHAFQEAPPLRGRQGDLGTGKHPKYTIQCRFVRLYGLELRDQQFR